LAGDFGIILLKFVLICGHCCRNSVTFGIAEQRQKHGNYLIINNFSSCPDQIGKAAMPHLLIFAENTSHFVFQTVTLLQDRQTDSAAAAKNQRV